MPTENQSQNQAGEQVTPPESAAVEAVNWDDVAAEFDHVEGDVEVLAEPAVGETAPVAAAPETEAPAAAETQAVAAPAATPVAPAQAPAPRAVPPAPQLTPEQLQAQQAAELARLEELYRLSEEDSSKMFTEPETVLPKLLAKMHQNALKEATESLQNAVPRIMQTTEEATRVETEARTAFFSVNADLAKPEYEDAVLQAGALFRKVNPTAPRDEAVRKIGELARVMLGLPGQAQGSGATPPVTAPAATQPFTPTRGGTGGAASKSKNMWEELATEFDSED